MRGAPRIRWFGWSLALAGAVLGLSTELLAQPTKVARVAILGAGTPSNVEPFREGLRDLGWVEGHNLVVESRFAEWHYDRLPRLAAELVRWRPDVILTHTGPGVLAARQATSTIPIVVGAADQLVEKGIVASLSRPGGNVTGLTLTGAELDAKRLQLLKEMVPGVRQVAILVNPANVPIVPVILDPRNEAVRALGLRLVRAEARGPSELDNAFATMAAGKVDALLVTNDATLGSSRPRIAELALKHRLPTVAENPLFAEVGGLLAYGPRYVAIFRRAAHYADRILKGARPGDLPIEQPATFTLVVNLKTAKALGIAVPSSILARADQAIQ